MPTEAELREQLRRARPEAAPIDVDGVIRRSRRRRFTSRVAVGATATLAVVGLGVAGLNGIGTGFGFGLATSAGGSSSDESTSAEQDSSAPAPASEGRPGTVPYGSPSDTVRQAPANKINLCEGTLADVAPSPTGLRLTPVFPETASVGTGVIEGTVVMENVGDTRAVGTTGGQPAMTLSRDSTVLWHSNGFTTMVAVAVDLEPGESMEYPASFEPVRCEVQDDTGPSFREGLLPVPAGTYTVSAAIDFVPDPAADPVNGLVTGPVASIVLR